MILAKVDIAGVTPGTWGSTGQFLDSGWWREMPRWSGRVVTALRRPWRGLWGAGRSVEAASQARAGESELLRTAWLIPGVFMRSSAYLAVPLTCIAVCVWCNYVCLFLEGSSLWSWAREILVGSSRGVATCGVVRAWPLEGREHCSGGKCPGKTWRERHTEGLRACWPRASDRSRVKQRIHATIAHFAADTVGWLRRRLASFAAQVGSADESFAARRLLEETALPAVGAHLVTRLEEHRAQLALPHGGGYGAPAPPAGHASTPQWGVGTGTSYGHYGSAEQRGDYSSPPAPG